MSKRHEQLLFRYSSALERGDFQGVAAVLHEAERDPVLEQMILDMNEVYAAETPGRFKHTNHTNPKEVPMIAPLYQRRAAAPTHWHTSLPLVAALAVVALLTVLLASQIRLNPPQGNGSGSGDPGALAQAQPLCTAVTNAPVDVHSRALSGSAVIGALASGANVTVYDTEMASLGGIPELWYFVTAEGIAGWVPAQALDAAGCGAQPPMLLASTATPSPFAPQALAIIVTPTLDPQAVVSTATPSPAEPLLIAATATPMPFDPQTSAGTATPIPANPDTALPTLVPPQPACSASIGGQLLPVTLSSRPGRDAEIVFEASAIDPNGVTLLDTSEIAGETWYYVRLNSEATTPQGWMISAMYDTNVTCALINRGDLAMPMLVPSDVQALPTLVPTDALAIAAALPPTVVPPQAAMSTQSACSFRTTDATEMRASADSSAPVIAVVPAGVQLFVLNTNATRNGLWLEVTADVNDVSISSAWVASSSISSTLQCPEQQSVELPSTALPADVQAIATALPTLVPPATGLATPQYYVYVVQPGDTLFSILLRFHLDATAMPEVMRINNLTEDSLVAPGITLYVPASQQLISLACQVTAPRQIDVLARPAAESAVVGIIPQGAEFELTDRSQQTDGVWYAVSFQLGDVTLNGGWIRPGTVAIPVDCQHNVPGTLITLTPALEPTVVPPTVPPPALADASTGDATATPFPTATLIG